MDAFKRVLSALGDLLKKRGFRKRGKLVWQLAVNNNLAIVSLQSNVLREGSVRFAVNLGVVSSILIQVLKGIDFFQKGEPGLPEQALQTRLGLLMPEKSDFWWEITEENSEAIIRAVESAIVEYGLPYLEVNSKDERLLEHWLWVFKNHPDVPNYQTLRFLAVLLRSSGKMDELPPVLAEIKRNQGEIPGITNLLTYLEG